MMNKTFENILEIEGINSKGFGTIAKLVMLDQRLTIEAKAIYSYFCSYAGGGSSAFPSVKKILHDLRISETRYYKHFALLKECGYVSVRENKVDGKFSNNIYTLHFNPVAKPKNKPNPQNEGMEKPSPCFEGTENESTENESTENEGTNINNININKYNNLLDDDDDTRAREITEVENMFEMYSSKKLTNANKNSLMKLLDTTDKDLLIYSIQKLEDVEKPMSYLKKIIKNYLNVNIQTVAEAKEFDKTYSTTKKANNSFKSTSTTPTVPAEFYYDWMDQI